MHILLPVSLSLLLFLYWLLLTRPSSQELLWVRLFVEQSLHRETFAYCWSSVLYSMDTLLMLSEEHQALTADDIVDKMCSAAFSAEC